MQLEDTEFGVYDDDFAEASIEAISLAALRPAPQPDLSLDHAFPPNPPRRIHSALAACRPPQTPALARLPHHPHPSLWHHHVLALPHNAIRAELVDLCALLHAVSPRTAPLLTDWHIPFDDFLARYFQFEKDALIPWVYASHSDTLPDRSALEKRAALITQARNELSQSVSLMRTMSFANVIPLLVRASRELTDAVLSYFDVQDRNFPSVIRSFRTREDACNVERLMARRMDVGILLRWIASRTQRAQLRTRLLSAKGWISWLRKGNKTLVDHLSIVHAIVDEQ
ncbi:hypothetical protein BWQ96_02629 [Gracilariopsis chorda]|uniref:Hemerythrin-like domain-containing protein n=1 Tax=Gracilariopsis chorda TaxID=448386 RepID=A0A2V3J2M2_9FLOR|nr:hypothetical protein BWQ96_02629 [Gracilariopsis chorda]|eukprot:PXF47650.1 hypothetical protein BWQ96_02629 [Gracilariopsis chorda]